MSDVRNDQQWWGGIHASRRIGDGGVGTLYELDATLLRVRHQTRLEVTAQDPPHRQTVTVRSGPLPYVAYYEWSAVTPTAPASPSSPRSSQPAPGPGSAPCSTLCSPSSPATTSAASPPSSKPPTPTPHAGHMIATILRELLPLRPIQACRPHSSRKIAALKGWGRVRWRIRPGGWCGGGSTCVRGSGRSGR
ncbi:hypothetical protein ACFQZ4_26645 [Catellatospora coxensis]